MMVAIRKTFDGMSGPQFDDMGKFRSEINVGRDLGIDGELDLGLDLSKHSSTLLLVREKHKKRVSGRRGKGREERAGSRGNGAGSRCRCNVKIQTGNKSRNQTGSRSRGKSSGINLFQWN